MTESIVSFASFKTLSRIHPADSPPLAYVAHFKANSADGWTLSGQLEVVGGALEQDTTEIHGVCCECFLGL